MEAHGDLGSLMLALTVILVGAKIGGDVAQRFGQPAVLGELMAGLILGNLGMLGVDSLGFMGDDPVLDAIAQIGVVVLLFGVGLESTLGQRRGWGRRRCWWRSSG